MKLTTLAGRAGLLLFLLSLFGCGTMLKNTSSEPVSHDPGKRSLGSRIDDETIELRSMINLGAASDELKKSHIVVTSINGYVLLVGQVPTQELKDQAAAVVKEVRDVRRIYNELEIAGNTTLLTRTSDNWITTKVKSGMLLSDEIQGTRVKVTTENGVVYLLGLVTRSEAERIQAKASTYSGVERVVSLFEYID